MTRLGFLSQAKANPATKQPNRRLNTTISVLSKPWVTIPHESSKSNFLKFTNSRNGELKPKKGKKQTHKQKDAEIARLKAELANTQPTTQTVFSFGFLPQETLILSYLNVNTEISATFRHNPNHQGLLPLKFFDSFSFWLTPGKNEAEHIIPEEDINLDDRGRFWFYTTVSGP